MEVHVPIFNRAQLAYSAQATLYLYDNPRLAPHIREELQADDDTQEFWNPEDIPMRLLKPSARLAALKNFAVSLLGHVTMHETSRNHKKRSRNSNDRASLLGSHNRDDDSDDDDGGPDDGFGGQRKRQRF